MLAESRNKKCASGASTRDINATRVIEKNRDTKIMPICKKKVGKILTQAHISMQMFVYFYFHLFCSNFSKGVSATWSLGMDALDPTVLCRNSLATE